MERIEKKGPGFIKRSLGLQAVLLIIGITALTLGIAAIIGDYFDDKAMQESMEEDASEISGLLRIIIDKPMVVGDDEGTSREFTFLADKFPTTSISIASFTNNITYSTRTEQIRKNVGDVFTQEMPADSLASFRASYARALKGDSPAGSLLTLSGRKAFLQVSPIFNEKNCHHCHGASQPVLGAMAVLQDVQHSVSAASARSLRNALISAAGGVLLILGIYLFIQRRIIRRLSSLGATSDSIVGGDFNARFTVSGEDQIGYLAGNLGDMLGSLKQLGTAQSVMHGMRVPSVMCDTGGKIIFVNAPLLALLEDSRRPENLLGTPVSRLLHGGAHTSPSVFTTVLNTRKEVLNVEESIDSARGTPLRVRFDANPVLDLEGNLIGAFSTLTDLTAIRENEAAVLQKNATIGKAAQDAGVLTQEMGQATGALAGQIEDTRRQAAHQQELSDLSVGQLEQLNVAIGEVARNTSLAAEHADSTREGALRGAEQAARVETAMQGMVASIQSLKTQMQELGSKTDAIGQVIQVIQDIADQTNLLALNAAIEAARAGDAGRGFAVVAGEVRKLAEKTMQATGEVERTVTDIRQSAASSIRAVDAAGAEVTGGAQQVHMTGEVLQQILALAESVAEEVQAIAAAVEEQSVSTEHVRDSIRSIRDISETAAQATQETEKAVRSLMGIASSLNSIVAGMTGKEVR